MEAGWFKSGRYRGLFYLLSIIIFLDLSRWNITDGFEQTLMVEPRYPYCSNAVPKVVWLPFQVTVQRRAVAGETKGHWRIDHRLMKLVNGLQICN